MLRLFFLNIAILENFYARYFVMATIENRFLLTNHIISDAKIEPLNLSPIDSLKNNNTTACCNSDMQNNLYCMDKNIETTYSHQFNPLKIDLDENKNNLNVSAINIRNLIYASQIISSLSNNTSAEQDKSISHSENLHSINHLNSENAVRILEKNIENNEISLDYQNLPLLKTITNLKKYQNHEKLKTKKIKNHVSYTRKMPKSMKTNQKKSEKNKFAYKDTCHVVEISPEKNNIGKELEYKNISDYNYSDNIGRLLDIAQTKPLQCNPENNSIIIQNFSDLQNLFNISATSFPLKKFYIEYCPCYDQNIYNKISHLDESFNLYKTKIKIFISQFDIFNRIKASILNLCEKFLQDSLISGKINLYNLIMLVQKKTKNIINIENSEKIKQILLLINNFLEFDDVNFNIRNYQAWYKFYIYLLMPMGKIPNKNAPETINLDVFSREYTYFNFLVLDTTINKDNEFSTKNFYNYKKFICPTHIKYFFDQQDEYNKTLMNLKYIHPDLVPNILVILMKEKQKAINNFTKLKTIFLNSQNNIFSFGILKLRVITLGLLMINNILDGNSDFEQTYIDSIYFYFYTFTIVGLFDSLKNTINLVSLENPLSNCDLFTLYFQEELKGLYSERKYQSISIHTISRIYFNIKYISNLQSIFDFYSKIMNVQKIVVSTKSELIRRKIDTFIDELVLRNQ